MGHKSGLSHCKKDWKVLRLKSLRAVPDTKVGTFTQALYDEAKKKGWTVISMKNDWKRIFSFE
jgi:hypothetical protein